eukprot:232838-Pleurochrysis_carterae.AAC.5
MLASYFCPATSSLTGGVSSPCTPSVAGTLGSPAWDALLSCGRWRSARRCKRRARRGSACSEREREAFLVELQTSEKNGENDSVDHGLSGRGGGGEKQNKVRQKSDEGEKTGGWRGKSAERSLRTRRLARSAEMKEQM